MAEMFDVVIAGGGVIGCATARALLLARPTLKVCLLEKEAGPGMHQSGRNSGVVHVGYNQKPGSLKAKFVVEGSQRTREFCREQGITCIEDGILIVAHTPAEVQTLETLHCRGEANGAQVRLLDKAEMAGVEPNATGLAALHAPQGASFDAKSYVTKLAEQAQALGVRTVFVTPALRLEEKADHVAVRTDKSDLEARVFVNAAGLHADRLASQMGANPGYQIVPFRGYYSQLRPERRELVNAHIYPCPDLNFPFLGVHLSRTFDGRVLVGPGAALALGREAYRFFQANLGDAWQMLRYSGFWRLAKSPEFRWLFRQEWKKSLSTRAVAAEARLLCPLVRDNDLVPSTAGIRAQLVSKDGKLVEDLSMEQTPRSVHVLNAVSPALTCSLPFADHITAQVLEKL
jgi:L-2-hydroxyglutarate oxidase